MSDKYKVPQAIADYINYEKEKGYTLFGAFTHIDHAMVRYNHGYTVGAYVREVYEWLINGNQETFAKAWIYGFEVKAPTWAIVSKKADDRDNYWYVFRDSVGHWTSRSWNFSKERAIKYAERITDPKLKDALLYANKGFEAIEVEI